MVGLIKPTIVIQPRRSRTSLLLSPPLLLHNSALYKRSFSTTSLTSLSSASTPKRTPVQAKDRPSTYPSPSKHPSNSYLLFHPIYSENDLDSVKVVHRPSKNLGDKIARTMCIIARSIFDFATRYPNHKGVKFPPLKKSDIQKTVQPPSTPSLSSSEEEILEPMTLEQMRSKHLCFGPDAWLNRIIFLETIAGVPGMVAASCRHLQSLRLMKRDKGWIHTLLEDAENERMHLLTFMELAKPGPIARGFALLAQGIFYNFFFIFYLISPRVAHRFVGVLEEEAVLTYSSILEDMKEGRLPEWENVKAPEIAKQYWQLGDDAMLIDVIRAVRADEATHRHINHTLAGLEKEDPNPFAVREVEAKMRGETYGLEREEALEWARGVEEEINGKSKKQSGMESAEKTA